MKRAVIWSLVAVAGLATLGAMWFVQNFEQVPVERWQAPQKEARRNPYLALERLLGQLGRPVTRIESPRTLDALPAGGVLMLDHHRRRNVDAARSERLLAWVAGGGYLIVAAESVADDPLLKKLGLSHYRAESNLQCEAPAAKADETKPPEPIEIRLPGNDTGYRYHRPGNGLSTSQPEPAWRAGLDFERNALLHYAWGSGQITVVDGLDFLDNARIAKHDHAELLWALLRQYQPQGEIRLASRLTVPTLWQWLGESAWMVLLSGAVLIALWLWRIIPRFGGTLATPPLERRDLAQHLAAIGRSVWREGGVGHWLTVVRQAVHQRLALRHPWIARLDAAQQRGALAKLVNAPAADIGSALESGRTPAAADFAAAMQTLQRLERTL